MLTYDGRPGGSTSTWKSLLPEGDRIVVEAGGPTDELGFSKIPDRVEVIVILIDANRWACEGASILSGYEGDNNCKEECNKQHVRVILSKYMCS